MNLAASVEGREHLRLFCALRLPDKTIERLAVWQRQAFGRVGDVRIVPRENLHVTLAFLGRQETDRVGAIAGALREAAAAAEVPVLRAGRYRETRSVGMLVLAEEEPCSERLAVDLFERLERLGVYERERRRWLPHLTVIRFRRPPRLHPEIPDLGVFSPSDAAVYMSVLRPGGAQYDVLESVALGR